MTTLSKTTGRAYKGERMVYILNPVQTAKYLKHGMTLYDIFESNGSLVFVFDKDETKEIYDLWCKRELN